MLQTFDRFAELEKERILQSLSQDEFYQVRLECIKLIQKVGPPTTSNSFKLLMYMLNDEVDEVRIKVFEAVSSWKENAIILDDYTTSCILFNL